MTIITAIKDALDTVLNHKQMGKMSVDEYNSILPVVISNIQNSLFDSFRKLNAKKMAFQQTPNYGDETLYLKQAIEYYISEKAITDLDNTVQLYKECPDLLLLNSVFTPKAQCEKTDLLVFNQLNRIDSTKPTDCSPIFTLNSGILKVSPKQDTLTINYYRKAKTPRLTSKIVLGKEIYDTDAQDFQDIDIHHIMVQAVFIELLTYYGIHLQEPIAIQTANQLKQEELIKQQ
ncbi:hypothetical protein JZ968_06525 [Riemerella anatipestifer]